MLSSGVDEEPTGRRRSTSFDGTATLSSDGTVEDTARSVADERSVCTEPDGPVSSRSNGLMLPAESIGCSGASCESPG